MAQNRKKLEAKAEENKKKAELIRKQQIEARNKMLENYCESEWTSMAALEDNLKEIEQQLDKEHNKDSKKINNSDSDRDEDEEEDNLYCIACDKAFKSDKAFANHENSKKHKTNVAFLKRQLQKEEELIDEMESDS